MDCEAFFESVDRHLAPHCDVTRTESGGQCVADFFHPRVRDRLGTDGVATQFNRSGVVWAPAAARLGVTLRVPAGGDGAVKRALAGAPLSFDRTDHRGVPGPDGQVVTVVHYSARASGLTAEALSEALAAVGRTMG